MARTLGRYELLRPLAQGGMAEVFVARRRTSGGVEKRLVLKRIRRERANDPRFVNMFVQEARLSMSLAHKNIVPVFDFGRAGDELFLAMEFVDGCDLAQVFAEAQSRGHGLDPVLVAFIALEACQALDYAHSARDDSGTPRPLIHRDVTPRNVLISRAGEVKLVDFGVATNEAEPETGKIRGTPAYMAPEQARGEPIDGRADLFSLGLIMWEALAGRRAYEGRDNQALLVLARAGNVPALPETVPAALREIVERATAASRDARYASSRDMQLALDEYLLAARAAAGGAPPSHVLAELVQARSTAEKEPSQWQASVPGGRVVTFLDDGADQVLGAALGSDSGIASGTAGATMRSVAETAADMRSVAETAADMGSVAESAGHEPDELPGSRTGSGTEGTPGQRAGRFWPWFVSAGGLAAAVVLAGVFVRGPAQSAAGPGAAPQPLVAEPAPTVMTGPQAAAEPAVSPEVEPVPDAGVPDARPARPVHRHPVKAPALRVKPAAKPAAGKTGTDRTGTVKISATPWAKVSVAGTGAGCDETPCSLSLPEGDHVLTLENPVAGLHKERTVHVVAGETAIVRETLTR